MTYRQYRKDFERRAESKKALQRLERAESSLKEKEKKYYADARKARLENDAVGYASNVMLIKNVTAQRIQIADMLCNFRMILDMAEMQSVGSSFLKESEKIMKRITSSDFSESVVKNGFLFRKSVDSRNSVYDLMQQLLSSNNACFSDRLTEMSRMSDGDIDAIIEKRISADKDEFIDSLGKLENEFGVSEPTKKVAQYDTSGGSYHLGENKRDRSDGILGKKKENESYGGNCEKGNSYGKGEEDLTGEDKSENSADGKSEERDCSCEKNDEEKDADFCGKNDGTEYPEDYGKGEYELPPTGLLSKNEDDGAEIRNREAAEIAAKHIEEKTKVFGVELKTEDIIVGPSYSLLKFGITNKFRVSEVRAISDDIEFAAESRSRLLCPIPGTNQVGVEISNKVRSEIYLRYMIDEMRKNDDGVFRFGFGFDLEKRIVSATPDEFVHLLVGGSTGFGKSMFLHSLILQTIYNYSPKQVRLVLTDMKIVEFSAYAGIPHLWEKEIYTDFESTVGVIDELEKEMTKRYEMFIEVGARNIAEYNAIVDEKNKMPLIMVFIDEYADLRIMSEDNDLKRNLMRLVYKSRACGIHFILATQRPSREVISGDIRANFTTRISFRVPSSVDSRVILSETGAEKLMQPGELLYKNKGTIRLQAPFVSEEDIRRTVAFVKGGK